MKHVLGGIAGLVLGAFAAAGLVHLNPLTGGGTAAAAGEHWTLAYSLPGPDLLTLTHGGALPVERAPADVAELWEETIGSSALASLRLEDGRDAGPVWATRISVPSTRTNLLLNGVVVDDYWLVSKPEAGVFFVRSNTNVWPVLKDTLLRVDVLGRDWAGPARYAPTLEAPGSNALLGATGRFAGSEGRVRERIEIGSYAAREGIGAVEGSLVLELEGSASAGARTSRAAD